MNEYKDFGSLQLELLGLNVNDFTEKKNDLTYLSWANAWKEFLKVFPSATFEVKKDESGRCYFGDEEIGYMVYTSVTAGNVTREMWLPVMDGANKAMKLKPYTYQVKDWAESKKQRSDIYKQKTVDGISMFDINKTVMRCLTKNLAMFGLGLYIYSGEDLPESQPTNIDCNDLITVGASKGLNAAKIEKFLKANYGHGMEYISKKEHDDTLIYLQNYGKKEDDDSHQHES